MPLEVRASFFPVAQPMAAELTLLLEARGVALDLRAVDGLAELFMGDIVYLPYMCFHMVLPMCCVPIRPVRLRIVVSAIQAHPELLRVMSLFVSYQFIRPVEAATTAISAQPESLTISRLLAFGHATFFDMFLYAVVDLLLDG